MNKEELSKMSGENQGGDFKFDVPMLTLEGEDGYFRLTQNKQETKLGNEVKGVMLKFRCQYGAYLNEGERILFTSEEDNAQKKFDLIEITTGKNGKKFTTTIDKGTGKELKERNPDLKFKQMIYFLLDDGQIVKLQVKGSSLSNLYRTEEQAATEKDDVGYFNQFANSEHKFEFETILQANQYSKKIGSKVKTFFRIKFVKGGRLDDSRMEEVGAKIKYVFDRLQAIKEMRTNRDQEQNQPPVEAYEAEPAPDDYEYQE